MNGSSFVFGILPVAIGIVTFGFYLRGILWGNIKPHAFSWLLWTVLTAIAFSAQFTEGAGAGAWFVGYACISSFCVFVLSLFKGEKNITLFDWVALLVALLALIPWRLTHDPFLSVLIVTFIDACGYLPTFRKGYTKPFEESPVMFAVGTLQFFLSIAALQTFSVTTWFYPLICGVMNLLLAGMLFVRRSTFKR